MARSRPGLVRAASGALGAGLAAGAWYALRSDAVQRADVRAGEALRRLSAPGVDRAVVVTTDLGSMYAVVGSSALLAATGRRRAAADVAALGSLAWVVSQRSKTFMRRSRPYESDGVRRLVRAPAGSSFPSGHAAVAVATTTLLAGRVRPPVARWGLRALGGYVAASRVYVGVHYPTDVVGGAGLGLALGSVWAGLVAAAGRGAVTGLLRGARVALPPLSRAVVRVGLGLRLPRRRTRAGRPPAPVSRMPSSSF